MILDPQRHPLAVVVGSGGVGKTTLAAALGVLSATQGRNTLVMTFDPSLRLKDTLGVGEAARDRAVRVELDAPGSLYASLLDARKTFDRLIRSYAPDERARDRILGNRFYDHLAGRLSGILEYMAVERLFEVAGDRSYDQIILDTPPTRQALDFLEAPERIVAFLDSGALKIALKPWFNDEGRLKLASRVPFLGKSLESFLDRAIGLGLLGEMAEFFQAFAPLYEGFRQRALEVQQLLRSESTNFLLVSGPGPQCIPDTMFFARRLVEAGHRMGPLLVNRVHPEIEPLPDSSTGNAREAHRLLRWLGERDQAGLEQIRELLPDHDLIDLPLLPDAPNDLDSLGRLGTRIDRTPAIRGSRGN